MKMNWKLMSIIAVFALSLAACKSKKAIVKQPDAVVKVDSAAIINKQMNVDKEILRSIANGSSSMTLEQQDTFIKKMKKDGYSDTEIQNLLVQASSKVTNALAEKNKKAMPLETQLSDNFSKIMQASSYAQADAVIKETLEKFVSPDAPVLIILFENGDDKDYDKPTTIKDYLNYLKLQKKSNASISKLYFDDKHKIKSMDLKHN